MQLEKDSCDELAKLSRHVCVSDGETLNEQQMGQFGLFEHRALPTGGGLAFVGGPVSVLSWHPWAPGICVTAAHRFEQQTHEIVRCYRGSAHMQLWKFSPEWSGCLGVIPHDGECTWDLKWRPEKRTSSASEGWRGTFAAALGDGSVMICAVEDFERGTPHMTFGAGVARKLEPTTILLRRHKKTFHRSPVRVVEWSPDGSRLIVGSANGNIEVYEAESDRTAWPRWSIPAQESVITDIRWLSPTHFCTLGMSCVLRLRDIRDPVATLEQNSEGLQGSMSMAVVEPHVAVVGADTGHLRVVRLSGADGVLAQNPVRRVYLQTSPFRDMRSVVLTDQHTVLYTGGAEGIVHEVLFPRPIWPSPTSCSINKTKLAHKMRWNVVGDEPLGKEILHLQLGSAIPPLPKPSTAKPRNVIDQEESTGKGKKRKPKKKRGLVGREPDGTEGALFGNHYKQCIVVTRISINEQDDVIAVGIDGGFITWVPLNTKQMAADLGQPERAAKKKMPKNAKRGRPKKNPPSESVHREDSPAEIRERADDRKDTRMPEADGNTAAPPIVPDSAPTPAEPTKVVPKNTRERVRMPKRKRAHPDNESEDVPAMKTRRRGRSRKIDEHAPAAQPVGDLSPVADAEQVLTMQTEEQVKDQGAPQEMQNVEVFPAAPVSVPDSETVSRVPDRVVNVQSGVVSTRRTRSSRAPVRVRKESQEATQAKQPSAREAPIPASSQDNESTPGVAPARQEHLRTPPASITVRLPVRKPKVVGRKRAGRRNRAAKQSIDIRPVTAEVQRRQEQTEMPGVEEADTPEDVPLRPVATALNEAPPRGSDLQPDNEPDANPQKVPLRIPLKEPASRPESISPSEDNLLAQGAQKQAMRLETRSSRRKHFVPTPQNVSVTSPPRKEGPAAEATQQQVGTQAGRGSEGKRTVSMQEETYGNHLPREDLPVTGFVQQQPAESAPRVLPKRSGLPIQKVTFAPQHFQLPNALLGKSVSQNVALPTDENPSEGGDVPVRLRIRKQRNAGGNGDRGVLAVATRRPVKRARKSSKRLTRRKISKASPNAQPASTSDPVRNDEDWLRIVPRKRASPLLDGATEQGARSATTSDTPPASDTAGSTVPPCAQKPGDHAEEETVGRPFVQASLAVRRPSASNAPRWNTATTEQISERMGIAVVRRDMPSETGNGGKAVKTQEQFSALASSSGRRRNVEAPGSAMPMLKAEPLSGKATSERLYVSQAGGRIATHGALPEKAKVSASAVTTMAPTALASPKKAGGRRKTRKPLSGAQGTPTRDKRSHRIASLTESIPSQDSAAATFSEPSRQTAGIPVQALAQTVAPVRKTVARGKANEASSATPAARNASRNVVPVRLKAAELAPARKTTARRKSSSHGLPQAEQSAVDPVVPLSANGDETVIAVIRLRKPSASFRRGKTDGRMATSQPATTAPNMTLAATPRPQTQRSGVVQVRSQASTSGHAVSAHPSVSQQMTCAGSHPNTWTTVQMTGDPMQESLPGLESPVGVETEPETAETGRSRRVRRPSWRLLQE